jgi:DNA polymerase-3 subunit delta
MPDLPNVILLHGTDEYAISQHLEKLCAGLGDSATADMNISRFDGRTPIDFEALNTAVNAAPFLSPRRVVMVFHPNSAFATPESRKKFLALLDSATPTTTIALAEDEDLNKKNKSEKKSDPWLLKWAMSRAPGKTREAHTGSGVMVHLYNAPKPVEMTRWMVSEAKKLGGKIEPDAAARLAELVGEDTGIAVQELTKLLTYVNYKRPVTRLDVDRVSVVSAPGKVFDLVDALGQGNGKKAQRVLHRMLEQDEIMEIWGMVIRQFRLLLQARELLDANASTSEIQKALGLHEFVAPKVTGQARRFSISALESIYHKLLVIDEGAKTSRVPLDLALDQLVVELAKK